MVTVAKWSVRILGHFTGAAMVFAGFALLFLNEATLGLLQFGFSDSQMSSQLTLELGVVLGISVCFWALLYIAFAMAVQTRRSRKRALVATRGTVMTETLIVLPVFFLLTFGLAQMGINSMAGLLTTLGTYQAARTIAVWGPEVGNNRMGSVNRATVDEKARLAAAAVITPVAPTLVRGTTCDINPRSNFDQFAQNLSGIGTGPWSSGIATSMGEAAMGGGAIVERWSFVDALDTGTFAARGYVKLRTAYCNVHVTYSSVETDPDSSNRLQFETTVTYTHKSVMPLVGRVFETGKGEQTTWGDGISASAISRTYQYTQQISPNPKLPCSFGDFSC